jgi:hypothetical protein
MKKKMKGISRIDSKDTHGWYVRVYADRGVFESKLFSDRLYGSKEKALENAIKFRDHNQMVADIYKRDIPKPIRKMYFSKPGLNNSSGVVGVNKVTTAVNGRKVQYYQATWCEEGKACSKKFYINSKRTLEEAKELAVQWRKEREKELSAKQKK